MHGQSVPYDAPINRKHEHWNAVPATSFLYSCEGQDLHGCFQIFQRLLA